MCQNTSSSNNLVLALFASGGSAVGLLIVTGSGGWHERRDRKSFLAGGTVDLATVH